MVRRIVEEISQALDNNLFMVAFISALTLPDICGKAEYPALNTGARYKNGIKKIWGNMKSHLQLMELKCLIWMQRL